MKTLKLYVAICGLFLSNALFAQSDTTFWFAAPEVASNGGTLTGLDRPVELHITTGNSASTVTISLPANTSFSPITQTVAANSTALIDLTTWIDLLETKPANQVLNTGILIKSSSKITAYYEVSSAGCGFCNPEIFTLKGANALGTNFFIPSQNIFYNSQNYSPAPRSAFDIIATEDNTTISITPTKNIVGHTAGNLFTITLNKGQTFSSTAASELAAEHLGGSIVTASKKIAVTIKDDLMSNSSYGTCSDLGGDQIIPITLLGTKYIPIRGYLNAPYDKVFIMAVSNNTQVTIDGIVTATLNSGNSYMLTMNNPVAYIETSNPVYVLHLSGFGCEAGLDVLPAIECTGSANLSVTRSTPDPLFLNLLVPAGGQNSFKYNGLTGIISGSDFSVVPGTAGAYYFASKSISLATTPGGANFSVTNTDKRFQMGVIHGTTAGGCRFGYFSDYNIFKANITANKTLFCAPDTLRLHADSITNTIIQWTGPNGFTSTAANPKKFINSINDLGYYKATITDATCGIVKDSILVTVDFPSVVTNNNTTTCLSNSIQLNTTGAVTYSWTPATGLSNPNIANPIANPSVTTQYIVTGTTALGCIGKDTVVITVSPTGCSGIGNIINDYTPVLAFDPCKNILTVGDATAFNPGDTVLVIQMKGAVIDSTNTAAFGTITDYKNSGNYEFNYVKSKTGNTIELKNVVTRNYDLPNGKVQLIRVPYYQNATIASTLTCPPWNGSTGGVLVLNAADSVTLNADIDVKGKGFRGGAGFNNNLGSTSNCFQNEYVYPLGSIYSGNKGESITSISNNITGGKGALASAGGAGLDHNGGGGGGANGGAGGFGGYQLKECGNDPFDNRGIGGRALTYNNTANKIFMGGGGGSGHANNPGTVPAGGNGGGIIMINAQKIKNNGFKIIASGDSANICTQGAGITCHDGMGGGGAGGTVLLNVTQVLNSTIVEEKGGKGADMTGPIAGGTIGPGGGAGGGVLWMPGAAILSNVNPVNTGGIGGVLTNGGNINWGTTAGAPGINVFNLQVPVDAVPFKVNIDSVRFSFANNSCNSFNFFGFGYVNSSPVVSWLWNFGDGNTATTQNTSHTYSSAGTYTVRLTITDNNGCKDSILRSVVVAGTSAFDFSYKQDVCNPLSVQFTGAGAALINPYWSFGDLGTSTGTLTPTHTYTATGNYLVRFSVNNACNDTVSKVIAINVTQADIVLTPDTTICFGSTKLLRAQYANDFCWSPATYLNNPALTNPTTSTPANITYYYTAEILGNNLVPNGDFSSGNTGFTSDYSYQTSNSVANAVYGVTTNAQTWNAGASPCLDHTNGTGNMLVANGATVSGKKLWKSSFNVTPNTSYQFSAWIQSVSLANFAVFKFYINGVQFGPTLNAPPVACQWVQQKLNWNSGNNTTVDLSLEDFTYDADGNDFALDDISFNSVSIKRDSVKITVDTPKIAASGTATVCAGVATQLNATGGATYVWTPATGLSNATIANPLATPATNTTYTVTGTTVNGCSAQASVAITIQPKPVITKSNDTSICKNTSVQLLATGGTSYVWTPAATLNNPNIANPIATPTAAVTQYYVTVINNNVNTCSNRDSVKVTIKADPVFTVSPAQSTCNGTPAQLNASGGNIYLWSPAALVSNAAIANPAAIAGTTTNYSVTITESVCNVSKTLFTLVTVNPVPLVTASKSNDIDCSIEFSNLSATGAAQYTWTPTTGLNNSSIANPVARPVTTTQYVVKGSNAFGCYDSDTLTVAVTKIGQSLYLMPNTFTPNGDGKNDCFGIKYWGIVEQMEFSIYNRYGERVFYTTDPYQCWNGLYKSDKPLPGNYVYYIKAKTACGTVERKGNVLLIR
ncbi:PKD domain-containing protein [Ferruginibacter profundus]